MEMIQLVYKEPDQCSKDYLRRRQSNIQEFSILFMLNLKNSTE